MAIAIAKSFGSLIRHPTHIVIHFIFSLLAVPYKSQEVMVRRGSSEALDIIGMVTRSTAACYLHSQEEINISHEFSIINNFESALQAAQSLKRVSAWSKGAVVWLLTGRIKFLCENTNLREILCHNIDDEFLIQFAKKSISTVPRGKAILRFT